MFPEPAWNNCVPVLCGFDSPASSTYTLTKYVDPNSVGIQSVAFVFQVLLSGAVRSSVVSTVGLPPAASWYICTIELVAAGFTAGISPELCHTLSPRINSGDGILSLKACLLASGAVLVTPKPSFFHKKSTLVLSASAITFQLLH